MKCYKLVNMTKGGDLAPLYVGTKDRWQVGELVLAKEGDRTASGKVKSELGELAYRPGLHASVLPFCFHIGAKKNADDAYPSFRKPEQVWIEIEVPDLSYQDQASAAGHCARKKQLDYIPVGGHYFYKTNSNASDLNKWVIAGEMVIVKILTDAEVEAINAPYNVRDLPRL